MDLAAETSSMDAVRRFREYALSLPDAYESSHMETPDFRIGKRIFATLVFAARGQGVLKITPEQQALFVADAPQYFKPVPGGWGRMGMTLLRLDAPADVVAAALCTAYKRVAQGSKLSARKKPAQQRDA